MALAAAIDIGGTKISGALIDAAGGLTAFRAAATPPTGGDAILEVVIELCRDLIGAGSVIAVGIGSAGQIDVERGMVTYANANLPGWTGRRLRDEVAAAVGLPAIVDNDVNAMAYGEYALHGAGFKHVLYLTVGTGIGGALILDGRLWRGAHWGAGEIGYLIADRRSGIPVSVEDAASGAAMERRYQSLTGTALSLREIAARAAEGDEAASGIIRDGARVLGETLKPLIGVLDPERVVIGGGVAEIGALWWEPLLAAVHDTPLPAARNAVVVPAKLGAQAGLVGAGLMALHAFETRMA